jgi:hypothetical protein
MQMPRPNWAEAKHLERRAYVIAMVLQSIKKRCVMAGLVPAIHDLLWG